MDDIMKSRSLVDVAWAFVTAGHSNVWPLRGMASAFAKLGCSDSELFAEIAKVADSRVGDFNASWSPHGKGLANAAWARG